MTTIRAQWSFESASGIPQDESMNVWHFNIPGGWDTDVESDVNAALNTFYSSISAIYSENTITGDYELKIYDLIDAPPRVPKSITTGTITDLDDGDALPTECSIVMSFEGSPESGLTQRRRRGRVYLGPLSNGVASTALGLVTVGGPTLTLIQDAAQELIVATGLDLDWVVFSPTTAGAPPWDLTTVESATTFVASGWIDNAFDTQRRRGTIATTRLTFEVP